jgi:hypothetical protein
MAVLMNRPGGSLTFCRAAFRNGATWRSFETSRRPRSCAGA